MTAYLKSISASSQPAEYKVRRDVTIIGRNPNCDIYLDDGAVSRTHARIRFDGAHYVIADMRSRNGTMVNNVPVEEPTVLYNGDRVTISGKEFLFSSDDPEAARPARHYSVGSVVLDESLSKDSINITSQVDLRNFEKLPVSSMPDLAEQLKAARSQLKAMMEMMKVLGKVTREEELLDIYFTNLFRLFPNADVIAYLVPKEKTGMLTLRDYRIKKDYKETPVRISRSVPQYVFGNEKGVISENPSSDPRFNAREDSVLRENRGSVMAVPVIEEEGCAPTGVLMLDARSKGEKFTKADLELLVGVSRQIALYQENLRFQRERHETIRKGFELKVGQEVQQGILPEKAPVIPGYSFFTFYSPANELGGDYYDFIQLPDGRLAAAIADVSGKGVPAALLMAKLSSDVRFALFLEKSLPASMSQLNHLFATNRWGNRFATFILLVLEPLSGKVQLFNAGHLLPYLLRGNGSFETIGDDRTNGAPIGLVSNSEYRDVCFTLNPGESILLMSDGITDAANEEKSTFNRARVEQFLKRTTTSDPKTVGYELNQSVRKFVGDTPQSDDQCVLIIGRNPQHVKNTSAYHV